jgi:large subunit ribosomal protein L29
MKAKELREMSAAQLGDLLEKTERDIMKFRLDLITGQVENVRAARNARRNIARIKTIIREREAAGKGK